MSKWTVWDGRYDNPPRQRVVETNADAIIEVAEGKERVWAVKEEDNSELRYESGVFGESTRLWDSYNDNEDGSVSRYRTNVPNDQVFGLLANSAKNGEFVQFFICINDLTTRVRWDVDADWFKVYTV